MKTSIKILFKLSGESLSTTGSGVEAKAVKKIAQQLKKVNVKGIALAIVVGGGNIWRFRDNQSLKNLARVQSDYLGMSATVFNAAALTAELLAASVDAAAFSAIDCPKELAKPYSPAAAKRILNRGGVVVLAGGTGKPFVTTDTGAAMRAAELGVARVLKATNVDGVYDSDPRKNKKAKLLKELTYTDALKNKLGVMDEKAFQLLRKAGIETCVFNFEKAGLFAKAAAGQAVGTIIQE